MKLKGYFLSSTTRALWSIFICVHFLVEVSGRLYQSTGTSHVLHESYCSDFPIGRLTLGCNVGTMVHIDDSVIFSRNEPSVRLKALGNHQSCDHARSCSVTFQTYHSGWHWLNCLNITYTCITASCPTIPHLVFGSHSVDVFTPGGTARYRCDHGYMLHGAEISRCVNHDNRYIWYPQAPTCEYNCRNLVLSPHPVGAYMSMCFEFVLVKKQWEEARDYCVRNKGKLITYESMDFFETAFEAKPEIRLAGQATWGTFWTSSEEYRPRYCKILNVNVLKTVDHYTRWMRCDRRYYFICEYEPVHPKRCSPLPVPENGAKSFSNESIGALVSFTCSDGYAINGTATRKCLSSGMWSGEEPRCLRVDCGKPDIVNGSGSVVVSFSQTTYLSFANYSCGSGHLLHGDRVRVCLGNGTWSGQAPECQVPTTTPPTTTSTTTSAPPTTTTTVIDCGDPLAGNTSDVLRVTFNSTVYRSVALYRCDGDEEGEESDREQWATAAVLVGEAVRVCMVDGTWNGTLPVCHVVATSEFAGYSVKNSSSTSVSVILVAVIMCIILAVIIVTVVLYKKGKITVCFHKTKGYPTEAMSNPTYMEVGTNSDANVDLSYSVLTENEECIYEEIPGDRTL